MDDDMSTAKTYRLRHSDVTAVVWTGENVDEMKAFAGEVFQHDPTLPLDDAASIHRPGRTSREIYPTDVLVRHDDGTLQVMIPAYFEDQYGPVND